MPRREDENQFRSSCSGGGGETGGILVAAGGGRLIPNAYTPWGKSVFSSTGRVFTFAFLCPVIDYYKDRQCAARKQSAGPTWWGPSSSPRAKTLNTGRQPRGAGGPQWRRWGGAARNCPDGWSKTLMRVKGGARFFVTVLALVRPGVGAALFGPRRRSCK